MTEKVLIVGLGATGLSFARHFARQGKEMTVVDTRENPPALAKLAKSFPEAKFERLADYAGVAAHAKGAELIAVSPGVPPDWLALPDSFAVAGDLEIFLRAWRIRWAGSNGDRPFLILITGTNGKSTCAALASGLLRAAGEPAEAVGNIGEPLLDAYWRWENVGWPRHVVAEVSSFQLATTGRPSVDIACLLNIGTDHLDWHGGEKEYVAAKLKVFDGAGLAVFNRSDRRASRDAAIARTRSGFGGVPENCAPGEWCVASGRLVRTGDGNVVGPETGRLLAAGVIPETACAALAVADVAGRMPVGADQLAWLSETRGLPHRLAKVGERGGVDYFDDSKATNADAAIAALGALGAEGTVLIAGGEGKGQNFSDFARKSGGLSGAVLIGESAPRLRELLGSAGVRVEMAGNISAAVRAAAQIAAQTRAERVLLSPACSSLDMFASYSVRGDAFCDAVRALTVRRNAAPGSCNAV